MVTPPIEQGIREANPYLTGLSSFLGFAVFGAQGVLLGPLIICLATLIYGGLGFLESSMAQVFVRVVGIKSSSDDKWRYLILDCFFVCYLPRFGRKLSSTRFSFDVLTPLPLTS